MSLLRTLAVLSIISLVTADDGQVLYTLSDEQYYEMPRLFHLDDYDTCVGRRGLYCLGSFELTAHPHHQLFQVMQRYSANYVDHFNHTRLHRGLCLTKRCPRVPHHESRVGPQDMHHFHATWFASCVNASTMSSYNLSAQLYSLKYCHSGPVAVEDQLTPSERGFVGLVAALVALSAVSTILDLTLSDHTKKGASWALAWSLPGCWRALHAAPPSAGTDLRSFDGLRILCMMCVIVEHVVWLTTHSYLVDTRGYEQLRRAADVMLMANSTLVVQIFFLMSSFLLAHKILTMHQKHKLGSPIYTFCDTMFNRIVRISPSYFVVVWFAASWWERLGRGPMWSPMVGEEATICRRKWWTHLLYINNIIDANDKCLIQTWYLAADMQLYLACLALTLVISRWRRGALVLLSALLVASVALLTALAYMWKLVPTFVMHSPESVRAAYADEASFNVLYQSPLGNAPGALAGLLMAHAHHVMLHKRISFRDYKVVRWISVASVPLAVWWVATCPRLLDREGGPRAAAAALAALERPVFATFVTLALLGAVHGVPSTVRSILSWSGWRCWARLSFGALLLHMPINKALVASRLAPTQLDRPSAILEWFGVAAVSYLAALPLALLVEIPAQRLHKALQRQFAREQPPPATEDRLVKGTTG